MKKIFLLVALIATAFTQNGFAQHDHSAENTPDLLSTYYQLKDALVAGNAALAASKATELSGAVKAADEKVIGKAAKEPFLKHISAIAETKNLKSQREHFAPVSDGLIAAAKSAKLSAAPVYRMYCPMKKSSWLSSEKTVKNPYYGSAMLGCGEVAETIK